MEFYAALAGISGITGVSGHHIGPIFKDEAVQELGLFESMTFENGTYGLYRNVG